MRLDNFVRGYDFQQELNSFLERVRDEISPAHIFEYPYLQQRLDNIIDSYEENILFSLGVFFYRLIHPVRTLDLRNIANELRKTYVKHISERNLYSELGLFDSIKKTSNLATKTLLL